MPCMAPAGVPGACSMPAYALLIAVQEQCRGAIASANVNGKTKSAHSDSCLSKFSALQLPAAPSTFAKWSVTLNLPSTGPCSDIRNVCLPGRGGDCMVAVSDRNYKLCPAYPVSLAP